MPLELFERRILVAAIVPYTFERVYIGYGVGGQLFLVRRDDVRGVFDCHAYHLGVLVGLRGVPGVL